MGKGSKKRNLRKKVKAKAKKLKEITAEEILMNPALLQSPEFKALPLEKQFQLTSQVKQMKMMMRGGLGAPSHAAGGPNSSLYHKLNDLLNKNARAENENNQLRMQVDAETARAKELYNIKKETRAREKQTAQQLKRKQEMDEAQEAYAAAQAAATKTEADEVREQTERLLERTRLKKLKDQQEKLAEQKAQLREWEKKTGYRGAAVGSAGYKSEPKERKPSPDPDKTPGTERIQTEMMRAHKDATDNEQAALVDQLTTLENNGQTANAQKIEKQLYQTPRPDKVPSGLWAHVLQAFGMDDNIDHDSFSPITDDDDKKKTSNN